jgi:Domain of Unknown Function with PDB structure (DUF3857)/Transglutaminase-like superfamily
MNNRLFCKSERRTQATDRRFLLALAIVVGAFACAPHAVAAGDAPQWMHALVGVPLSPYDEKTDAVLLYSDTNVTVLSADKIKTNVREAYKILRPKGRDRGTVAVYFNPQRKIKNLHGWCIPAKGKDFEVKEKDAIEVSPPIEGGELISDVKYKLLRIPAPDPGNIVGYEYEVEDQPFFLEHIWYFQEHDPVRESHYSLELPPGWEYKVSWLSHPEIKPTEVGNNGSRWVVTDVKGIRDETEMPPLKGVMGQMLVSFFPRGGRALNGFAVWSDMGKWYSALLAGRVAASDPIKQQATALTSSKSTPFQKMQALAEFVQHDIRYVAIELGIGGWQPHPAPEVFSHHYGDCKDKATLMRSMLQEIGIESYHVIINTERGSVTRETPPHNGFNHAITALKLPDGAVDPSLLAILQHPKLGRILFFDPTDQITPFGQIRGALQSNYGLLVTPDGGELVELPQQASDTNSIRRMAKLTLDSNGTLSGEVKEVRLGDRASAERWRLRAVTKDADRIKPIEDLLAGSLASFHLTHASFTNLQRTDQPFGFDYTFESNGYAKNAGGLLLVRPRVIGRKSSAVLETKEPRQFPVEFKGPSLDTDSFDIALPPGYEVDELPPPVTEDHSFASYHSKTEASGGVLHYTRTLEIKELSVPVSKMEELKRFYRVIASDERNNAVLKATAGK